jgi:uncharacterized protein YidB (DUF937 family)
MKQTAVEFLVDEFKEKLIGNNVPKWVEKIIQQALEMEKEQIEKAFEEGMFHHTNGLCPNEYYKETFKSE